MRSIKLLAALVALTASVAAVAQAEPGTHSDLTALTGQGSGIVEVSPTSKDQPIFDVEGTANIHDALPSTTYRVARAVDRSDIGHADGVCPSRSSSSPSWRAVPADGGLLSTSNGGAGALHFEIHPAPPTPFVSGVTFDVQWQVIKVNPDGTLDRSQELRSDCFTVTVK